MKDILVTGGLGFIGSHICVELLNNNYNVIIIDNLINSKREILNNIIKITNNKNIKLYEEDLLHKENILNIFKNENIDIIIHCAGLKSVNESINLPYKYYNENINMTLNLLEIMNIFPIKKFIFSSSATVYGVNNNNKFFIENDIIGQNITNPYGQTKYMQEIMLKDFAFKNKDIDFVILRYFNPVGSHKSGLIGEDPNGIPNNLMPFILRVAANNNSLGFKEDTYDCLKIFGNNYNTKDGTCIRDFIHVVDLAKAHEKCIHLNEKNNYNVFNIGTGKGTSVLEMVNAFKKVNKINLNYIFSNKREGDPEIVTCNVDKARNILKWETTLNIDDCVKDGWNYITKQFEKNEN